MTAAVWAAASSTTTQGSWWAWLAGFAPGLLVIAVAYLVVRRLRRRGGR